MDNHFARPKNNAEIEHAIRKLPIHDAARFCEIPLIKIFEIAKKMDIKI
jgi:hypothetical protein